MKLRAKLFCLGVALIVSCSSVEEGEEIEFRFTMTPDDGGTPYTFVVLATRHAPEGGACALEIYEVAGSDRYVQYGPNIAESNCIGYFNARVSNGAMAYDMVGQTQRVFGAPPTTPFATGTYCEWASAGGCLTEGETGTFTAIEDISDT